jgi:general secretion pathway protein J
MYANRSDKGFTLIEILIAIAILGVIMTIVYGSFIQTRKVMGAAEASVEGYREIRAAFRLMTSDISMAFLSPQQKETTLFVGTDESAGGTPADNLDFTAYSHHRRDPEAKESDQTEIGYFLRKGLEEESALMRREKKRIDASPLSGGKVYEVSSNILGLDLRYRDSEGAWSDSWDSRATEGTPRLPSAVEITLIVQDRHGLEHPYRTVVELPLAGP